MTEAKFTPKPWWPYKNSAGNWGVRTHRDYEDPNNAALARSEYAPNLVYIIGDHTEKRTSGDTIEANAHLIAAAPDMYEALDSNELQELFDLALEAGGRLKSLSRFLSPRFRAALKKARGEA